MGQYFDDVHAMPESQLGGGPCEVADSPEVAALRAAADYDGLMALAKALGGQLRYREAAEACTRALALRPDDPAALRLRAGRRLSTLQCELAEADLLRCLALGGEALDIKYRLGLCRYLRGDYPAAMSYFEECMPLCGDEMGIAAIFWHTLSAWRAGRAPALLGRYRPGMDVGHHGAYERAVRLFAGQAAEAEALAALERQAEDMEYVIEAYGAAAYLAHEGKARQGRALTARLLARDGFWICYTYIAAWNDRRRAEAAPCGPGR